jgi:hypothetical protein
MDGRAWLRRTDARYDVITLEPMPPNFAGTNSLYSREFYEIAASRLAPGGLVVQWVPFHLLSLHHTASVVATFQAVLPDAMLWIEPYGGTGILIGRTGAGEGAPKLGNEWPGLAREGRRPLDDRGIRRAAYMLRDELALYARRGEIITDDSQLLSFGRIRAGGGSEEAEQRVIAAYHELATVGGPPWRLPRKGYRPEADWWKELLPPGAVAREDVEGTEADAEPPTP